jgi:hypothetical protein
VTNDVRQQLVETQLDMVEALGSKAGVVRVFSEPIGCGPGRRAIGGKGAIRPQQARRHGGGRAHSG